MVEQPLKYTISQDIESKIVVTEAIALMYFYKEERGHKKIAEGARENGKPVPVRLLSAERKNKSGGGVLKDFLRDPGVRYLFFQRKYNASKGVTAKFCWLCSRMIGRRYGLDIFTENIGKYLYIGHPFGITVNTGAVLGNCVSLHKGCTIGQANRGEKMGCPTVGNCVWIGINATVVGKINIGDDVLIAPNAFVNCDVPSHSIVIGNPCIIKHREHATRDYLRWVNEDNYQEILGKPIDDHSDLSRPQRQITIK